MPYPRTVDQEGWGVYRVVPWHMHGIYRTELEADAEAVKAGNQYAVGFGSSHARSGNFTLVSSRIHPPLHGCV
jgi:hypothetical protein